MDKLLSYYDVLLRTEDLYLLQHGEWLNDQVIAFFFEFIAREVHPKLDDLLLITGATAFLLAHAQGAEAESIISSLKMPEKKLVLFAVNNNPFVELAGGGSHWSLLAYSAHDGIFNHYDSASGSNRQPARMLSAKLNAMLRGGSSSSLKYEEPSCPQQQNGYDCGMYVLATAELLCQRFDRDGQPMSFTVSNSDITQTHVTELRGRIRKVILDKVEQQQQHSSSSNTIG